MSIYFSTNRHTGAGTWGQGAVQVGLWQFIAGGAIDVPHASTLDARMEPERLWYKSRVWNEINGLYSDWLASGPISTLIDLAGTLSFVGALTLKTMIGLAGAESFTGTLALQTRTLKAGTLDSAGALQLQARPNYVGSLSSSGQLSLQPRPSLAASLGMSGTLDLLKSFLRSFSGVLTSAGEFTKGLFTSHSGTLDGSGEIDAANIGQAELNNDDPKRWRKFQ